MHGRQSLGVAGFAAVLMMAASAIAVAGEAGTGRVSAGKDNSPLRLNFADRQRMLNEMIAKALCLTDQRVKRTEYRNQLAVAQFTFQETLQQLTEGSAALELTAETRPELQNAVAFQRKAWVDYAAALNGWSGARWGSDLFAMKVYEVNASLYPRLNETIDTYGAVYKQNKLVAGPVVNAIVLAGQQRMLTQKMGKEVCQLAAGFEPEATRTHLKQSLDLYAKSLARFETPNGDGSLPKEVPGMVLDTIELTKNRFKALEPQLAAIAGGEVPSKEAVGELTAGLDDVLRLWIQVTSLYEVVDAGG